MRLGPAASAIHRDTTALSAHWKWTTLGPILAVATVFVLTYFDPFAFETFTERPSSALFFKLYATLYPTDMRDNITIVTVDDATLDLYQQPWPPSQILHADLLEKILTLKPAAVLIDILFLDERNDDFPALERVINGYHRNGVPILFVAASNVTRARKTARESLQRLSEDGEVLLVSGDLLGEEGLPPLYSLQQTRRGIGHDMTPAALALYRIVCKKWLPNARCDQSLTGELAPMEVVWGLAPAQFNCLRALDSPALPLSCEDLATSWFGRAFQLAYDAFIPALVRASDPVPIPYHTEMSASVFAIGNDDNELRKLIEQKVVIYGSHVAPTKDLTLSPVHGLVDGYRIHAMALDNLLTFGGGYIRRGSREGFLKDWTYLQPTAIMTIVGLVVWWNRRRIVVKYAHHEDANLAIDADEAALGWIHRSLLVFVPLAAVVEFACFHVSPINWLGILVAVHIAHWLERRFIRSFRPEGREPTPSLPASQGDGA